jgi:hypothetical protein
MESIPYAHLCDKSSRKALKDRVMKSANFRKKTLLALVSFTLVTIVAWMTPEAYFTSQSENEFIRQLKKKAYSFNELLPEDRLYLAFDKAMYEPGETIWFSAFVRDGQSLKPSSKSDIVHVELLNPKGTVEKSINLIAKEGVASGDFGLDKEIGGGLYKIRAYTNWMKNDCDSNAFLKDIQVQDIVLPHLKMKIDFEKKAFGAGDEVVAKLELNTNENQALADYKIRFSVSLAGDKYIEKTGATDNEGIKYVVFKLPDHLKTSDGLLNVMIDYKGSTESISRAIPIVLNHIQFSVFPEGGDLVDGIESNVAFRGLNEYGKPADIEGEILDEKNNTITKFASYHQGMGVFTLTPHKDQTYHIQITKPEGITESFPVPEALQRGYVLNIERCREGELGLSVTTTEQEELSIVAQIRGKILYTAALNVKPGKNRIVFPTSLLPIGVAQITLFDSKGIARAERLVFVNRDKQLRISIDTDKDKYLPREKVRMTLHVRDDHGLPMPANLSLAVVNDQFLSFADDKSGNLLSQFLLEQDIREKVEDPSFYFNTKEEKSEQALDYLLMTAGWRRFTWEKILSESSLSIIWPGERAIVSGVIVDAQNKKPLVNARIKVNNGMEYQTDNSGRFIFNKLNLSQPVFFTYQAPGYRTKVQNIPMYDQNMIVYLYGNNYSEEYNYPMSSPAGGLRPMAGMAMDEKNIEDDQKAKPLKERNVIRGKKHFGAKEHENLLEKPDNKDLGRKEEANARVQTKATAVGLVADYRTVAFANTDADQSRTVEQGYYRSRQFPAPVYNKQEQVNERTDFRNTIYWNANVEVDKSGKKEIEFYASDDITSFRVTAEGIASDGMPGRNEKMFFTQLPFSMNVKVPVEVVTGDRISIPLTLSNNTNQPLGGNLTVQAPGGLKATASVADLQTLMPGKSKTIYLDYLVLDKIGTGELSLSFKSCGLADAFTQKIMIAPRGFPVSVSFSGQETDKEYSFEMHNIVDGSMVANLTAFPSVVSDLMKGVEGILREPYGCFEQTSMSSYPNAMVLDYLRSTGSTDEKAIALAGNLLDKGYKRLVSFETKDKGYEWFGSSPGHEALTAYGLMQFTDMKKVGQSVDAGMLRRTMDWLNSRKDGKGGFLRSNEAADAFGRANEVVTNAYIVYALSEAGFQNILKEFEATYSNALKSKDPYLLALTSCAAANLNEKEKAAQALNLLISLQEKSGGFTGLTHSVTCSTGNSLGVETTSLAILALLKSPAPNPAVLSNAVQFLVKSRRGSGEFGNTQGTILALKALTSFAKYSKKTSEAGSIEVYIDGKKAQEKRYAAGEHEAISITGLGAELNTEGFHKIRVKYLGVKTALPYSIALNWSTTLPESAASCAVELQLRMSNQTIRVGDTRRLQIQVTNKKGEGIPSTMAIIGIPAGFSVQPWQLKELQEKKVFDYYEIKGNNVAVYYRCMAPHAIKEINLDLKAELPGIYESPASAAYLYYTNELKSWRSAGKITISKTEI